MTENILSQKPDQPVSKDQADHTRILSLNQSVNPFSAVGSNLGDNFQDSVFMLNDTFYRTRNAKAVHWSIAWSDLMMTMFILFITLYAYQLVRRETFPEEYLVNKTLEVVGGSTTDALDITVPNPDASLPFTPLHQGLPLITAGIVKKVETVSGTAMTPEEEKKISRYDVFDQMEKAEKLTQSEEKAPSSVDAMYSLSQQALAENNLKKFASIDLVPDTTMRIILTGDLLFDQGKADLSSAARQSLQKIAAVIKETRYMINVTGHTDDLPMSSERFSTNWDLSVARASRVVRFLIEETGMNPNQFVVSGYSSFRPVKPNTSAENRAINRRVEIIISKKQPPPERTSQENYQLTL
jgi:chemotaxis protein MotB